MSERNTIRTIAQENPKVIGVLFALMLMLSQAGTVAAEGTAFVGIAGPS